MRIIVGVDEEGDKSDRGRDDREEKVGNEMAKFLRIARQAPADGEVGRIPRTRYLWKLDDKGHAEAARRRGSSGRSASRASRKVAEADAAKERGSKRRSPRSTRSRRVIRPRADFKSLAESLPKKSRPTLDDIKVKYEERKALFAQNEKTSRDKNVQLEDEKNRAVRDKDKLGKEVEELQKEVAQAAVRALEKKDAFQFDLPQGKIKRRLPDGIVEIDIGFNAKVQPGLTFTVLPSDFPEKGRQSRMRVFRVPNERNEYKNVERFVEKATIEVIDVLGPDLARARITSEADYIRDGAGPGDLLYNSVWRKGVTDRIALAGVFDINGDGTDDMATVVRDLRRMGITVDAYFDLRERKWVGQITEQTRFLIVGRYPVQSASDPNREEKTKLIDAISKAVKPQNRRDSGRELLRFLPRWAIGSRSTGRTTRLTRRPPI